ncbi:hypothetical protein E2C01_038618 [Portunus trituberculatus]|uniref:Endonuclease/exonuclease/phosphatase domain-containing protein n=1 Tax=Portunus trituberculatus TaxID=210409 RepID=A0A5B7FHN6_PORTR|nr:hypothetical protein [Portunus trituberculatus]
MTSEPQRLQWRCPGFAVNIAKDLDTRQKGAELMLLTDGRRKFFDARRRCFSVRKKGSGGSWRMAWAGSSNINPHRPSQPLPSLHFGNIPSHSRLFSPFSALSSPQLCNHSLGSPSAGMRLPNRLAPNKSCPSATPRSHTHTARRGKGRSSSCLTVVMANVRGLRTNVGDLTHNFALRHGADVVAVTETWLTGEVEPTFGKVPGFSHWIRKDKENRAGGRWQPALGTASKPRNLRQGRAPLDFLTEELDTLLLRHQCSHMMVVGDLNCHLEQSAYDDLLEVQGLTNHVTFPTHMRGGMLDPVLSDLPETSIRFHQLEPVGSSDHYAVLARVELNATREDTVPRTIWL